MSDQEKSVYPSETIELPSKGLLYPKGTPLATGKVEIMYPQAHHEDILTNQNYINKGVVIDKFIQAILISDINYNELSIGDKNAIMIGSRILAYGKDYQVGLNCPKCGEKSEIEVDLNKLNNKEVDLSLYKNTNEFTFELPSTKVKLTFKTLTVADEKKIDEELKYQKKVHKDNSVELTTRLKYLITSVNGDNDPTRIRTFVDTELLSRDSLEFRKYMNKVLPDVDMKYLYTCEHCGTDNYVTIPMTVQFFWPNA